MAQGLLQMQSNSLPLIWFFLIILTVTFSSSSSKYRTPHKRKKKVKEKCLESGRDHDAGIIQLRYKAVRRWALITVWLCGYVNVVIFSPLWPKAYAVNCLEFDLFFILIIRVFVRIDRKAEVANQFVALIESANILNFLFFLLIWLWTQNCWLLIECFSLFISIEQRCQKPVVEDTFAVDGNEPICSSCAWTSNYLFPPRFSFLFHLFLLNSKDFSLQYVFSLPLLIRNSECEPSRKHPVVKLRLQFFRLSICKWKKERSKWTWE